jgi:hypothetical protein
VWFKVDDGLAFHHKTVKAGNAAMGLWVRAGAWCGALMTDGFVPDEILAVMGTSAQAARLVSAGLWIPVDGGYQFHGWGEWQPSKADVQAAKKKESLRKKNWREARLMEQANSQSAAGQGTMSRVKSTGQDAGQTADTTRDTGSGREGSSKSEGSPIAEGGAGGELPSRLPREACRLPENFKITPEMAEWGRTHVPHVNGRIETEKFRDYWKAASGQNARKKDWIAAWRTWMRNADERLGQRGNVHPQPRTDDGFWER